MRLPLHARARTLLLASAALVAVLGVALERGEVRAGVDRAAVSRKHRESLSDLSDALYRKDRARSLHGRVLDRAREGIEARVLVLDAEQLSYDTTQCSAVSELCARDLPVELGLPCAADGTFHWDEPSVGHKFLFARARGFAPARRTNVLVCDGRVYPSVEVELVPERTGSLRQSGAHAVDVLALYTGWWPEESWRTLAPGAELSLEWRSPDGWPIAVALRAADGAVELRELVTDDDQSPAWELEQMPSWNRSVAPIQGAAVLAFSVDQTLQRVLAADVAQPSVGEPAAAEETGSISVLAEMGCSTVTLALRDGRELMAIADPYGQAVFHGVPLRQHMVRTSYFLGGESYAKAAWVRPGAIDEVAFYPIDRRPSSGTPRLSIVGVLVHADRPCPGGFVFCQPSVRGREVRPQVVPLDPDGRFRVQPIVPGTLYAFVFAAGSEATDVRHTCFVRVPLQPPGPDLSLELEIPWTDVRVPAPPLASLGDRLVVARLGAESKEPRWSLELPASGETVLHGLEPGKFELELWSGTTLRAQSEPFDLLAVRGEPGRSEVAWDPRPPEAPTPASPEAERLR